MGVVIVVSVFKLKLNLWIVASSKYFWIYFLVMMISIKNELTKFIGIACKPNAS